MPNDSSTGGYIQPLPPPLLEGSDLEDFFQALIVGITGIDGTLVRPRWQGAPPNIPDKTAIWCAFGFEDEEQDTFPAIVHSPGADQLQRHERFNVLCSFYGMGAGSGARDAAKILRDGLAIAQNREPLLAAGMGLVGVGAPRPAPIIIKTQWEYRYDLPIRVARADARNYPIEDLAGVTGGMTIQGTKKIVRNIKVQGT